MNHEALGSVTVSEMKITAAYHGSGESQSPIPMMIPAIAHFMCGVKKNPWEIRSRG